MQIFDTPLLDVKLVQPQRFGDSRGWFAEVFNGNAFAAAGLPGQFVQDNQSFSTKGVLRGLHYQLGRPQGKLVRVLSGHIWDVAIDLRRNSPDFGKWAGFHLRATSPDQRERFSLLVDLTQRMGLDPARIFSALNRSPIPEGLAEADLKDPAVKFFADKLGQAKNELDTFRNEVQQRWAQENQVRAEMGQQNAKAGIDSFADEKGSDGKPLRPHFDAVLPILLDLYRANPQRGLAEAYDQACWSHPDVRKQLLAAEQQRVQSRHDVEKAKVAQRGNTRGITSSAVRPPGNDGPSQGSLRDAIERSAEEVGY
jgi:hypothetical protein